MHNYLVDTNCLISFVTDRAPDQQQKISRYFEQAADFKCSILVIGNVITEFVYVLDKVYGVALPTIAAMIEAMIATPGIHTAEQYDVQALLHFWPNAVRDYGDAVLAAAAASTHRTILSFDKQFAKHLTKLHLPHVSL